MVISRETPGKTGIETPGKIVMYFHRSSLTTIIAVTTLLICEVRCSCPSWSTMSDCLRRNENPERNLIFRPTVGRACLDSWSLFSRSGMGYHTLVCLLSAVVRCCPLLSAEYCHLSVHLESMSSLSSFLKELLAVRHSSRAVNFYNSSFSDVKSVV
jgi:hypothetical protein